MFRALALAASVSLFSAGCFGASPDEDNYFELAEAASCKFAKRCSAYFFYYSYDDVEDCKSELEDQRDDNDEFYEYLQDECDFDEDKAKSCMSLYGASCKDAADDEDFFEDCDEVWDCPGT